MAASRLKSRIHELLEVSGEKGTFSRKVDVFLEVLITLNVIAVVLETVESIYLPYKIYFRIFDLVSIVIFSIEYVLRVWSVNASAKFKRPFWGNLSYMLTPMAIIDLLAIMPFYLPLFNIDLRSVRILRLLRLIRLFKLARYSRAMWVIKMVAKEKKEELTVSVIFTFILLLFSSTLMFYLEHSAQPEKFTSIPETMWWSIATITTVGYGDIYPITPLGKMLGGLIAILGIGLIAIPSGLLASGFLKSYERENHKTKCPHCGKMISHHHDKNT